MMGRVRGELYVTVPNVFRCPISLDVMKSPVSLCTGVTYDRSSIQHWLDAGHDTCPATMQVLTSRDFVPNLTLRRLINLWAQSSTLRPDSGRSPAAVSEQQVRIWINKIEVGCDGLPESLTKIVDFVSYSEENRRFLVNFSGIVEAIVGVLSRETVEIRVLQLVVRILDLMLVETGVKERLHQLVFNGSRNCFNSFMSILQNENLDSKIESVRVLESISIDNESKRFVAETPNLMSVLLRILNAENDGVLSDTVLSFLISVATTRSLKTELVRLGLVHVLSQTISDQNAAVPLVEKSLKLLSNVCACGDGRVAISEDPKCAGAIVERLMKVSKTATEDAVVVLWSMCCVFKDGRVQEKVVRSNGVTKLLLVMQSEGDGSVRLMCGDLIKVLRVGCKGGASGGAASGGALGRYETKTTHIMPC